MSPEDQVTMLSKIDTLLQDALLGGKYLGLSFIAVDENGEKWHAQSDDSRQLTLCR